MRNRLFGLLFLLAAVVPGLRAQTAFVRIGTGYALGTAFTSDDVGANTVTSDSGFVTESVQYGSYGGGLPVVLDLGYMFSPKFGFQLSFGYQMGQTVTYASDLSTPVDLESKARLNQLFIQPGLLIQPETDGLQPYGRVGLSLPLLLTTQGETLWTNKTTGSNPGMTTMKTKIQGTSQIGFYAAFGISLPISDQLNFFAEAQALAQRAKGGSGELYSWTFDGEERIDQADTNFKEWNYVEELTSDSNNDLYNPNVDTEAPGDVPQISQNLSNLGLKIGLKFSF